MVLHLNPHYLLWMKDKQNLGVEIRNSHPFCIVLVSSNVGMGLHEKIYNSSRFCMFLSTRIGMALLRFVQMVPVQFSDAASCLAQVSWVVA